MAAVFEIRQRGSTVGREILGGLTTFMAMSYILFVQPAVLARAGMDSGGVFMATCIASAAACILMGLFANYPIALAPGMGENFFFAFTLCAAGALLWPEALALTVAVGIIFLLLATVGFRSMLLNAIPDALKSGIAAGIGLFIALIGFEWGNLIQGDAVTFVKLAALRGNYVAALTLGGLGLTLLLMAFRVHGSILIGILVTAAATWGVGRIWPEITTIRYHGLVGLPHGLGETAGAFLGGFVSLGRELIGPRALEIIGFAFILLFMDLFDTVGTLVGVASRADLMRNGHLPRAERALSADAAGTVFGACLGTSTVTSYIESIAGVAAGARTGLAAVVTGLCMLAALFFQPLVEMVGGGVKVGEMAGGAPILRYPMIAPALILVGAMMMRAMREVQWDDITEVLPAFLAMVSIPFTYSIATGIAVGFVSYAFGKLFTGRARQCPIIVYVFAALFVLQYVVGIVTGALH
jgi:AGZA family xanthine/uracil permease-like MFS transporter